MSGVVNVRTESVWRPSPTRVCAYCAEPATHRILVEDELGLAGIGYCCDEPTHWAWLSDSVDGFVRELRSDGEAPA